MILLEKFKSGQKIKQATGRTSVVGKPLYKVYFQGEEKVTTP